MKSLFFKLFFISLLELRWFNKSGHQLTECIKSDVNKIRELREREIDNKVMTKLHFYSSKKIPSFTTNFLPNFSIYNEIMFKNRSYPQGNTYP